jgi:hypothetical protein
VGNKTEKAVPVFAIKWMAVSASQLQGSDVAQAICTAAGEKLPQLRGGAGFPRLVRPQSRGPYAYSMALLTARERGPISLTMCQSTFGGRAISLQHSNGKGTSRGELLRALAVLHWDHSHSNFFQMGSLLNWPIPTWQF